MRSGKEDTDHELHQKLLHTWLGVQWPHDLCFTTALHGALARGYAAVKALAALVSARAVPLTNATLLFESKVDGVVNFGRWLWTLSPGAQDHMDHAFNTWARLLLGAEPWRNADISCVELGWFLTGFARGVRSVVLRRARAWALEPKDWYKGFFRYCNEAETGWASHSLQILSDWGIQDWPSVTDACPTYSTYSSYVSAVLLERCITLRSVGVSRHQSKIPYSTFQPCLLDVLSICRSANLPWLTQLQLRGWCRVRAGLACFSCVGGRRSSAEHQFCIFCGCGVRNAIKHCVATCSFWRSARISFLSTIPLGDQLTTDVVSLKVLGAIPGTDGFLEAVALCDGLDEGASKFWANGT